MRIGYPYSLFTKILIWYKKYLKLNARAWATVKELPFKDVIKLDTVDRVSVHATSA